MQIDKAWVNYVFMKDFLRRYNKINKVIGNIEKEKIMKNKYDCTFVEDIFINKKEEYTGYCVFEKIPQKEPLKIFMIIICFAFL